MREGIFHHSNWPMVEIGTVCELVSRGTSPNYDEDGDVRAIGQRCVQVNGFTPAFLRRHKPLGSREVAPQNGDVLLNSTGTGTIGRSCIFSGDGHFMVDSHVTILRPGNELDSRWLNLLLRSFSGQQYLESYCFVGSTGQVELSRTEVIATRIPLPPLVEQRRIAEILDEVDAQIDYLHRAEQKKRSTNEGISSNLLAGDEHWKAVPLGELGRVVTGRTPVVDVTDGTSAHIPFVTPTEISDEGGIDYPERAAEEGADGVVCIPSGATLTVCIGFGIGKVGFLGFDACVNQQINALIPNLGMDEAFVFHSLKSASRRIQAQSSLQVTPIINKTEFSKITIGVPNLAEQIRISQIIADANAEADVHQREIVKLQTVKQTIMAELLTGKARVPAV